MNQLSYFDSQLDFESHTPFFASENLYLKLTTPLDKDKKEDEEPTLLLEAFEGVEEISQPFEFTLKMISRKSDIKFEDIINQPVTLTLEFEEKKPRYIHGIVTEFVQMDTVVFQDESYTRYRAVVKPKFWLLNLHRQCRIFQNKSTQAILKEILGEESIVIDLEDKIEICGTTELEYCVQYNESNFDFACRLMEEAGIYYYFKHEQDKHVMVLGDVPDGFATPEVEDAQKIVFTPDYHGVAVFNRVYRTELFRQAVIGAYRHTDYNYLTPKADLTAQTIGNKDNIGSTVYTYPGKYGKQDQGEAFSKRRIQAHEALRMNLSGLSTSAYFTAGYTFTLENHHREDANIQYTLKRIEHVGNVVDQGALGIYHNRFIAFDHELYFHPLPQTRKPRIDGVQTAVVTGQAGEEIWTDKLGRIKVKFHWDAVGSGDTTTCWIRVAQSWAGPGWGALYTPRIGHEVVVTFMNGDPDCPLVIGSVYNAEHVPPYAGTEPTKSTMKSQSTKNAVGFNEFRFEDKADAEEIYVHAQKDMNIDIIEDRTTVLFKGDCETTFKQGDRKVALKADDDTLGRGPRGNDFLTLDKGSRLTKFLGMGPEKGNDTTEITKGDSIKTITKGDDKTTLDEGNQEILLKKGNQSTKLLEGNESFELIKGNQTTKLSEGNQETELAKGNQSTKLTEGNQSITLAKGDQTLEITGKRNLTIKDGDELHKNEGDYTHEVKKNYTLKIEGNLVIETTGNITFKSKADMSVECTNLKTKSKAATTIEGTAPSTIKSGALMTVEGAAGVEVKAGGVIALKGAGVQMG